MNEMHITFQSADDMLNFLKIIERYPFPMILSCNNIQVNAKSLLGLMYIGCHHALKLMIQGSDCHELYNDIKHFLAA